MGDGQRLNVIDESGKIVGEETREEIHKRGLLHREIHVWLYTPRGEIVFQHRAKTKKVFPDLLDAAVGGHIEIGSDDEHTALKELEEETGIQAKTENLTLLKRVKSMVHDSATGMMNNVVITVFAYRYEGALNTLRVESGKAIGFEAWPFEKIFSITEEERKRFIPVLLEEETLDTFHKIQDLL